jgi:hypothetical protein
MPDNDNEAIELQGRWQATDADAKNDRAVQVIPSIAPRMKKRTPAFKWHAPFKPRSPDRNPAAAARLGLPRAALAAPRKNRLPATLASAPSASP